MEIAKKEEYKDFPLTIETKDIDETGAFSGYASTFGGKPDAYGDVIVEGAFGNSIQAGGRNGFGIPLLWQHNSDQPIGIWNEMAENKTGLKVEGQLAMNTSMGKDVYELLKMKAIGGMSIGYDIVDSEIDEKKKVRYLKEVNLWEVSLVTFPANTRARVTAVKAIEEAKTERELETALREAGLSKKASLYVVSLCRESLRDSETTTDLRLVESALKQINAQQNVKNYLRRR